MEQGKRETNPVPASHTPPKIALVIPYFGALPPYFPIWLKSAEANRDVDFLFYTDSDVQIDAPNFRVTKTTLEALRERFSHKLNRPVSLSRPYKLCDYKVAYGLFFEEDLRGYDFWGYCDIDLVLGRIRHFLTEEVLAAYDRFYAYGPLCVYRNNERMRRAFELPGSVFSLDDMFGPETIGTDEFVGMNRICLKNRIPWYTDIDFAHLNANYEKRLEITKNQPNYPAQIFGWQDGRAFQRYEDSGQIRERELIFIHWYQRRPVPEGIPAPGEAVVITPEKLLVRSPQDLTPENMLQWNPPTEKSAYFLQKAGRYKNILLSFFRGGFNYKRIWLKRYFYISLERRKQRYP